MIRRPPEAIVAAAKMDPLRRDLFVEGHSDKAFLEFFLGEHFNSECRIFVIDEAVECDVSEGGCKGRVLHLANIASKLGTTNLAFLVDADLDPLIGRTYKTNTISTHYPDIEAHALTEYSINKLIKVACGLSSYSADSLHSKLLIIAGEIGLLRYTSAKNELNLSITKSRKERCLRIDNKLPVFDMQKFLTTVVQNTAGQVPTVDRIKEMMRGYRIEFETAPLKSRIRGKDYQSILDLVLPKLGINSKGSAQTLMATIRTTDVMTTSHMIKILSFFSDSQST
jgi:hypothetical protein